MPTNHVTDDDVIVLDWRLVWERIAMLAQSTTAEASTGRSASLVLVVQDEPFERASTARHLRNAGLDVIEVASEDQARRVLDAVYVDIVFADLETSGQANEFSLLRLLYEHHPGAKTILTSDAETDMAAAEGYGIFLRKPYRLVDLDSSIQRILDANVSVSPANGTIWADTGTGSRRETLKQRRAADSADNVLDEVTKQWLAELSRQLAERGARQIAVDPEVATAARRDALNTYDRARSRRLRLMLGFALGAVLGSGITKLPGMLGLWPAAASIEQTLAVETVAMMSTPVAPELRQSSTAQSSPLPSAVMPSAEPTSNQRPNSELILDPPGPRSPLSPDGPGSFGFNREASNRTGSATQSAVVEATPSQVPLARNELQEVQTRLRSFGFNPGPIDGAVGPKTAEAVIKYQQARGQLQTDTVNRELLEQLRQDAAPELTRDAAKPNARKPRRTVPRRSDPL
jgi:CheY-like chemotaxis protein